MEIAIYARVSTQRQQHQQTIEQQMERLRAHIMTGNAQCYEDIL